MGHEETAQYNERGIHDMGYEEAIGEHAANTSHDADSHHEAKHPPEVPNLITLLSKSSLKDTGLVKNLHHYENPVYSLLVIFILFVVFKKAISKGTLIPGKLQNFLEIIIDSISGFFAGILGEKYGKRFAFYCTGLFIFIWCNNMMGLVPFMKAPTSVFNTTLGLAICTFCYVQYIGLRENGLWGYFHHLLGSPTDAIGWCLVPLMLPLHLIEEIAKPMSLALRLFGNILGEDILLGVMVMLGIMITTALGAPEWAPGLPLQLPFFFLSLLLGTIQALVFSLLSCIYIALVLPHDEHH